MKLVSSLAALCSLSVASAHHGQDFLVTLGAETIPSDQWLSTTSLQAARPSEGGDEKSISQSLFRGIGDSWMLGASLTYADAGSGSWDSLSVTPLVQWHVGNFDLPGLKNPVALAFAAGWEIPVNRSEHDHGDHEHPALAPLPEPPGFAFWPPFLQDAWRLSNEQRVNHTHDEEHSHAHEGIHRHGESHGFFKVILETHLSEKDRVALNLISVFPESGAVATGYAMAWRHQCTPQLALGAEATGDFRADGEHLVLLSSLIQCTEKIGINLGAGTGLGPNSPEWAFQTLLVWRF